MLQPRWPRVKLTEIQPQDYLEWQVSYDTDRQNDPNVVPWIELHKPSGVRYGCELALLLFEARRTGLLDSDDIDTLDTLLGAPLEQGIEETELIARVEDPSAHTLATQNGFSRSYLHVPTYLKQSRDYSVEIQIKHKQRAVGNQAMVYVHLPLSRCRCVGAESMIGRCAEAKETVSYEITRGNVGIISDTVVAFGIASVEHRRDLAQIWTAVCSR